MRKKYTIKDIANAAGVSIGTVDRVLHNRGKVSKKALTSVNKALKELDYRPNPIARTLKNNTVYIIKVLLPDSEKDPFWLPGKQGIEEVVNEYGAFDIDISLHYYDPSEPKSFLTIGLRLLDQHIDAFLFVPLFEKESDHLLMELEHKSILTGTFNSFHGSAVDLYVGLDLFMSGRVAAKLMADALEAPSKIAIVHIDEESTNAVHLREKEKGFRQFFETREGYDVITLTIGVNGFEQKFADFVERNENINALFVSTSKAYRIVRVLKNLGKSKVVLGYDLLEENIEYLRSNDIKFLIHQSPKLQASLGLKGLVEKLLLGKEISKKSLLPIQIINSENVDSYLY
ncbi:LacI family DNA-binding transcriptional regulator [Flagellimonas onchidii]|uniref:LacI family DNA-binding transcriptional regulator n=1 Tax=Flagellimonas onchidii TaxID=2562684 RepID=UPI0010A6B61B|nr:LacI family DNA-binding transcriptional regulator [Allomuricauda onchidii]